MSPLASSTSRRRFAALLALLPLAACGSRGGSTSESTTVHATPPTTLLVRLGVDTLAIEQYTRSGISMEGVLVSHLPFTTISRYTIETTPDGVPISAEYSVRRGDGSLIQGAMPSLSMRFGGDSVRVVGHRAAGDTARAHAAAGEIQPYVNGAYGMLEITLARLIATNRDSSQFSLVPLSFGVRTTTPMPIARYAGDSARIMWFGSPVYARHDGFGRFLGLDGQQTTVKVRVDRVANADVEAIAREWTAREATAGVAGPASPRDTVKATIGRASLVLDYGRPALRGRNVWTNGVLGDSIWRTGANAATQLRTSADLLIGGQPVPAGTYTLWTQASSTGYRLIINKQFGQWGTEYHPDRDLVRVALSEIVSPSSVERFTIRIDPRPANAGNLTLAWGTTVLSVPVTAR